MAKDRLLRLPITYDTAINDPRTNALTLRTDLAPGWKQQEHQLGLS